MNVLRCRAWWPNYAECAPSHRVAAIDAGRFRSPFDPRRAYACHGPKAGITKQFLDEHLGVWVSLFTAAIRAGAPTDYYRVLAELTDRFVKMEADAGARALA